MAKSTTIVGETTGRGTVTAAGKAAGKPRNRPARAGAAPAAAAGPRWRRRADARPAEILEAALTVFAARGFAAAKLEDVAAAAGVSKGTLYLYFDSKTALFEAMALELLRGPVLARADQVLQEPSAAAALGGIVGLIGEMLADRRRAALPKLIIAESAGFPELARIWLKTVIQPVRGRIVALIERGIAAQNISVVGRGKREPIVATPNGVAEARNRRVEILVR